MIRINGIDMPTPTHYQVDYENIGQFQRNANGNIMGDLVAIKATIQAQWDILSDDEAQAVLSQGRPAIVNVQFFDPDINRNRNAAMLMQRRAGQVAMQRGGRLWWKGLSISLTER